MDNRNYESESGLAVNVHTTRNVKEDNNNLRKGTDESQSSLQIRLLLLCCALELNGLPVRPDMPPWRYIPKSYPRVEVSQVVVRSRGSFTASTPHQRPKFSKMALAFPLTQSAGVTIIFSLLMSDLP